MLVIIFLIGERYGVEIIKPSELLKYAISVEDNNLEFYKK